MSQRIAENPLAGGSFLNWLRLWRDNYPIPLKYALRVVYITAMTVVLFPLRLLQRAIYGRRIQATRIEQDPVFVLGHYRSGGTHFVNLLTQDPQWGFLSTTQALLPELFLLGRPIRNLFRLFLHEKRPMDNVMVTPESPEEPEHAICNLIPYGFFQGFFFPERWMDYVRQSVFFEDDPAGTIQSSWREAYQYVLQACTLANGGKQLLIKNPPDTARLPALLEMFPDARFILLHRNPYVMFPSIAKFYHAYIVDWQLQDIADAELEENILAIYEQIMGRYQRDKHLIPQGRLVEVRFEDVEQDPLGELRRIYGELGLSGFEKAEARFRTYVDSQKGYQKNRHALTQNQIDRINQRWSADIQRWGYTPAGAVDVIEET